VLLGGPAVIGAILSSLTQVVTTPMVILILYVIGRMVLKKEWLSVGLVVLLLGGAASAGQTSPTRLVISLIITGGLLALVFRRGFLAAASAILVLGLVSNYPFALDTSAWYFSTTLILLALLAVIGVTALRAARGRLGERAA